MNKFFCSTAVLLAIAPQGFSATTAQVAAGKDQHIDETVVTASPVHGDEDKVIQGITVLSGDKLRQKSAATIGETLRGELGISSASFGPGVGIPVIRGQSANRVKVMQNSLDSLDASNTSPDHASSTEALLAERIEVLRGPSTLRFGNGAIGGVVNVIDNRIPSQLQEQTTGGFELRHSGVNNSDNAVFKLDGGSGNFAWHIDGLYRSANNLNIDGPALLEPDHHEEGEEEEEHEEETTIGFIGNTDARARSLAGGLSWIGENGFIGFSVNRLENNYGIPPGAHEHHEEGAEEEEEEEELVRIDLEQTRYDLAAAIENPLNGFERLSFNLAYNDYQHVELEGAEQGTRFANDAWESRLELVHNPWSSDTFGEWQGAIGLQLRQSNFAAIGEEAFVPPSTISNTGLFWLEDLQMGSWHIELGLRAERQKIELETGPAVSHNTITSSGAIQWLFTDNQHLSLSLTHAERAPSVEELFSNGPHLATNQFIIGDSTLAEEASFNYELGYHYHADVTFKMFLFYNDISDFIFQRNTGAVDAESELAIFRHSQRDASFRGAEAELSIPVNEQFTVNLFGDYVRAEFAAASAAGSRDVPRITPARIGTELEYRQSDWQATLRWTEAQRQNRAGEGEQPTQGYRRLDANISYYLSGTNSDYTLFLRGNNLLNEDIRDATSFLRQVAPQAGRNIELGVRMAF